MSKTQKERSAQKHASPRNEPSLIPAQYQHAVAIGILIFSLVLFFREPIFGGKVFLSVDNVASHSFDTYLADARAEGEFPLWNPYIFCGMPGYGSLTVSGERLFDISATALGYVSRAAGFLLMNPTVGWVIFYYIIFAAGMYLLAWQKLRDKAVAVIVSLAATYSVYIIIWIMSGHNTKIAVMSMFPYLFLIVDSLRERFRWLPALALVLALHFSFLPSHVQMIFYTYLALGVYLLSYLIRSLVKKENWKNPVRAGLVLIAATVIAFAMDADKYLSVLEYNPHSIRGSGPVTQSSGAAAGATPAGGLDYEYATNWSLGVGEVFTFFVPSLYGFGNAEYRGPLTNNQAVKLPFYFGPQPFTDAPQYMGIVVLCLAIIGFWRFRRDPFVQYLSVMIAFSLLVAFGKEFPLLYDLLYNYVPLFNKFRAPSMILVLVQIMVPLLAGFGLISFIRQGEHHVTPAQEKKWKYILGGLALLLVVGLVGKGLYRSIYESFFPAQMFIQAFAPKVGIRSMQVAMEFYAFLVDMVVTDVTAAFALLLVSFGSIYFYLRHSMKLATLMVIIGLATVVDLWRVNTKPMEVRDKTEQASVFAPSPGVQAILEQEGQKESNAMPLPPYRVLEFQGGTPPFSNKFAYWRIQSAYGYQGAKMRRYQDIVDVVGLQNPLLWQLMNVKYIVTDQPDSTFGLGLLYDSPGEKVYVNRLVLPRAFFVNRYEVGDGIDVLRRMAQKSFDARDVAYLSEDPGVAIDPPLPGMEATFLRYGIQDFSLKVTAYGNNLLFLSEAFYPEGWKATLDGSEIAIYRANYHFRAVVIPAGTHTLEMRFAPRGFSVGKNASLAANVAVLLAFAYFGWDAWRKKKQRPSAG